MRQVYPESFIRVIYFKHSDTFDEIDQLPINEIKVVKINAIYPSHILWLNKFYWRILHISLKERYLQNLYRAEIQSIEPSCYDQVFVRSAGLDYEVVLGLSKTSLLNKSYLNFHDPYPVFWDPGSKSQLTMLELLRLRSMHRIIEKAAGVFTPSSILSEHLQYLYGSMKIFDTIPHQFEPLAFNMDKEIIYRRKEKRIQISYHGALQFRRNIDAIIEAFQILLDENINFRDSIELVLRVRGVDSKKISKKVQTKNIIILDCLSFVESYKEQQTESDICIIVETCNSYSNTLPGKASVLNQLNKPILISSPPKSELRRIADELYVADCDSISQLKEKMKSLIYKIENNENFPPVFGDYFSKENFAKSIKKLAN
ncbi:MAG: hypothetical protein CL868_17290 [Cytophagaceae bacterium]|nr:hypothetical protein [Cytophagaceae bacterium]